MKITTNIAATNSAKPIDLGDYLIIIIFLFGL